MQESFSSDSELVSWCFDLQLMLRMIIAVNYRLFASFQQADIRVISWRQRYVLVVAELFRVLHGEGRGQHWVREPGKGGHRGWYAAAAPKRTARRWFGSGGSGRQHRNMTVTALEREGLAFARGRGCVGDGGRGIRGFRGRERRNQKGTVAWGSSAEGWGSDLSHWIVT